MALVLGIDTGGTYTDGVVIDVDNNSIIKKTKVLTTYNDLTICIEDCIKSLEIDDFKQIKGVSLSTTLATNAIVERRGCEVGLILVGSQPLGKLPTKYYRAINGGHKVDGDLQEELDISQINKAMEEFRGKVDAIAISSYFSVRNPEHELQINKIINETINMPVVCAHQLSSSLGFHERTVTAVLNAKLIPIIVELINSVKKVLDSLEINAPLMIVKGDGTLMDEVTAKEKPIETILSGPASSIVGGSELTKCSDALILDMGGTTTDIAILKDGIPKVNFEGAIVNGWHTRVKAAEINTYGIGGDSYIKINKNGELKIGPERVYPLSVIAYKYPYLVEELKMQSKAISRWLNFESTDCFILIKNNYKEELNEKEVEIVELLEQGPHTVGYMLNRLNIKNCYFIFKRLLRDGIIARAAITPTDILHVKGQYNKWNTDAAKIGVEIIASKMIISVEDFINLTIDSVNKKICKSILQSVLNYESNNIKIDKSLEMEYFTNKLLEVDDNEIYNVIPRINFPIVAVGAPVRAYLPEVAKKLNSKLIIPEHTEVANAMGAATGKWINKTRVIIKSMSNGRIILHTPWKREVFEELEVAKAYALNELKERNKKAAKNAKVINYHEFVDSKDVFAQNNKDGQGKCHIETRIKLTAIGRPQW